MHALEDVPSRRLSLTPAAGAVFAFSPAENHFGSIMSGSTLSEKLDATLQLYRSRATLPADLLERACSHIIEWHRDRILDGEHFSAAPHIIQNMNKCLASMGCQSIAECGSEIHETDRSSLHDALLARTMAEVEKSRSGCLMDMALKTYQSSLIHLGLRITDETKALLAETVEKNANTHDKIEWKSSCYRSIGGTEYEIAMQSRLAPHLS